jgi:hypothetical protein
MEKVNSIFIIKWGKMTYSDLTDKENILIFLDIEDAQKKYSILEKKKNIFLSNIEKYTFNTQAGCYKKVSNGH